MSGQAIVTKYLGPTNSRGSRVKATADAGTITISWDHALNSDGNHRAAATALANRHGWLDRPGWRMFDGGLPDGTGSAFVFVYMPDLPETVASTPDTGARRWLSVARDAFIEGRYDDALGIIAGEVGSPFIYFNQEFLRPPLPGDLQLYGVAIPAGPFTVLDAEGSPFSVSGAFAFQRALGAAMINFLGATGAMLVSMSAMPADVTLFAIARTKYELDAILEFNS